MRKLIFTALMAAGLVAAACSKEEDRSVKEVVLDKTEVSVVKGHDVQLTAKVLPENALEKTITWSSDNMRVIKGGSFFQSPRQCRSAARECSQPEATEGQKIGFRIVKPVE